MRTKLIALALAAMLAIGSGGVVAAGTSSGTSAEQLPDNYTVNVNDPFEKLSSDDVDEAIATAWSNEQVQNALSAHDDVHIEVVGGTEQVEVHIKSGPDAETEVVAEINSTGTVTDVFEPEVHSQDMESISLAGPGDYVEKVNVEKAEQPDAESQSGNEYDEKLDADESLTQEIEIIDQTLDDGNLRFNVTTAM